MITTNTFKRRIVAGVASLAIAGGAGAAMLAGGGNAGAVNTVTSPDGRAVAIVLTHDETVTASQIGAGRALDQLTGARYSMSLDPESKYNHPRRIPGRPGWYVTLSGQKLVDEAAKHRTGTVTLVIDLDRPGSEITVYQRW